MDSLLRLSRASALAILVAALSACGGGGGSDVSPVAATPGGSAADGTAAPASTGTTPAGTPSGGGTMVTPPAGSGGGGATMAPGGKSLPIGWTANGEADLAGYRVYYGTASRSYAQVKGDGVDAGRTTEFTITGLQAGATYYVALTAYDAAGNESDYSAEITRRVD
jgi:hypothetical protein